MGDFMKRFILALAVLATVSGSALAADLAAKARPSLAATAPGYPWGGCYVDGGAGFGLWNQDNFSESSPGVRLTADQTSGGRGWFGQIGGGCDYQFAVGGWGNFLIGALADYSFRICTASSTTLPRATTAGKRNRQLGRSAPVSAISPRQIC